MYILENIKLLKRTNFEYKMIKKFQLWNEDENNKIFAYDRFYNEYSKYLIEGNKSLTEKFLSDDLCEFYQSIFNLNGTAISLKYDRDHFDTFLTIGTDAKLINKTIKEIKSNKFKLEEIK